MINIGNIVAAEMDRIIDSEEHIKMFSKVASNKEQSLDDLIISLSSISENLESIGLDKSAQNILSVINSIIKEAADPKKIKDEKEHIIDEINGMEDPGKLESINELIDELDELNPPESAGLSNELSEEVSEGESDVKGLDLEQLQKYLSEMPENSSEEFEEDPLDLDSDISIGKPVESGGLGDNFSEEIKETSAKLDKFINKYSKEEKEDKKFNFNKKPEFNFNKKKEKIEKIDKKDKKDKKNSKPEFNFNKKKDKGDKGDKEDKKSNKFLKKLEKKLKKT